MTAEQAETIGLLLAPGWLDGDVDWSSERGLLALTVAAAEADRIREEFAALEVVLGHKVDGVTEIPDDLAECERWAQAVCRLGWQYPGAIGEGVGG